MIDVATLGDEGVQSYLISASDTNPTRTSRRSSRRGQHQPRGEGPAERRRLNAMLGPFTAATLKGLAQPSVQAKR